MNFCYEASIVKSIKKKFSGCDRTFRLIIYSYLPIGHLMLLLYSSQKQYEDILTEDNIY